MAASSPVSSRPLLAYVGPFALFALLQQVPALVRPSAPIASASLLRNAPEFWVYPLQTLLCGGLLLCFRRDYPSATTLRALIVGGVMGLVVFGLWVAPQACLHFAPRLDGFDPTRLLDTGTPQSGRGFYLASVGARFVRLVVVVPWLEEVFWRGFLLRYLVRENFLEVPLGTFTPLSFGIVTAGFMFEHHPPDWPAAILTGALYNWVAIGTKSLPACILAHALTNLLLGLYVMQTHQWGFW